MGFRQKLNDFLGKSSKKVNTPDLETPKSIGEEKIIFKSYTQEKKNSNTEIDYLKEVEKLTKSGRSISESIKALSQVESFDMMTAIEMHSGKSNHLDGVESFVFSDGSALKEVKIGDKSMFCVAKNKRVINKTNNNIQDFVEDAKLEIQKESEPETPKVEKVSKEVQPTKKSKKEKRFTLRN